ncbi:MAG: 2-amino-4-hydroxy-6-hydroxymethyldihydropteridine diphosphokinase [Lachnospiraceae bacterium]|nr:2-amino-4-hydroxy-6-hydroxymethyldihydropteridine diphosphokinase [Lachnospiraceae bacterium]
MDRIEITNLRVFAHHGVYEEETTRGQDFYVNMSLYLDTRPAGLSDELEKSVDYGALCSFIDSFMKKNTYKLIETVAENMSREILVRFPEAERVKIKISKPHAPIPLPFDNVSVEIEREWHTAFIGLGSNMGDRQEYIDYALTQLEETQDVRIMQTSKIIETAPYGGVEMDPFLNGVTKVRTLLTPVELLRVCNEIEDGAKRERGIHWGPRTLDLDILFYDKMIMEDPDLTIPHADMKNRHFVLGPMAELAPGFVHPVYGKTMADMLEDLGN